MPLIEDLTFFALIFLIGTFLLKLYNILKACDLYDIQQSIMVLAVGTICYLFVEIALLLNLDLEFSIYFSIARIFILLIWIFWFAELFIYAGKSVAEVTEDLTRMNKRRNDRIKKGFNRY